MKRLKLKICEKCGAYYGYDSHIGSGICLFFQEFRRRLASSGIHIEGTGQHSQDAESHTTDKFA